MAKKLYKDYADLPALEKQTQAILAMFKEVEAGAKRLSDFGIKISTSQSVRETAKLTDEFEKQKKTLTEQQAQLVKMAQKLAALRTEEAKDIESVKQVTALTKQLTAAQVKRQLLQQGEYARLQQEQQANKKINDEIKLRIQLNNARAGSEEKLALQYKKAQLILSRQAPEQREGESGKKLQAFALQTKKALDEIQQKVGNFKGNVGNYANSLAGGFKVVRDEIEKLKIKSQELQNFAKADPIGFKLGGGPDEINRTNAALEQLEKTQQIGFKTGQSYNVTVKQTEKAYQDLAASGNVSNEFLEEFKKFVAEAKDSAADLREEIKALSSDTRGLDLAVGTVSVLASTFEASAGAAALLGVSTEDVEVITQKLVAVQSVANGIREIGTQITTRGTAANKAYNFVVQQGTVLFGKGSTAAQRFGAALKGIVILAVIGFLIQLFDHLTSAGDGAEYAEKNLKKLNDELERNKKINKSLDESADFDFQGNLEILKKQGAEKLKLAKNEQDAEKIAAQNKKDQFGLEVKFKEDQIKELRVRQENANDDEIREAQRQNAYMAALQARGIKTLSADEATALRASIKATEDANIEARNNIQKAQRDLIAIKRKHNTELTEEEVDQLKKQREKSKENADREKQDAFDLFIYRKQLQKEQAEAFSDFDTIGSTDEKIKQAKIAADAEIAIIEKTKKRELDAENITAYKRILINEKAADDIAAVEAKLGTKVAQLRVYQLQQLQADADETLKIIEEQEAARAQLQADARQKAFDKEQDQIGKYKNERLKIAAEAADDEIEAAGKDQEKKLTAEKKYANKKAEIEFEYQKSIINSQIIFYEQELKRLHDSGEDQTKALEKLAELRAQLAQVGVDFKISTDTSEIDKLTEKLQELKQVAIDTFASVISASFDKKKNKIGEEINDIDKLKEAEINRVNKSLESEEKKAARVTVIEAKAQAQKEALQRRQRQLDRQKAIFDRGVQALKIIGNTAEAVTEALPNIPLSIVIGAIGAAQLITLLAQALPSYWTGTDSAKGGLSNVAEKGPELGVSPGGKLHYWQKPTVANVERGTKIFHAQATRAILSSASQGVMHSALQQSFSIDNAEVVNQLAQLNRKEFKSNIIINNEKGIESSAWYLKHMKQ